MDNREAALELYLKDWALVRIAKALDVSESTVIRWKKKDDWEKKKLQRSILMKDSTDGIWDLIHYQHKALAQKTKQYEEDAKNGEPLQILDRGNLDALQKLHSIVKKKDTDSITIIEISTELLEHVQSQDFKLAQKLERHINEFINKKRNE